MKVSQNKSRHRYEKFYWYSQEDKCYYPCLGEAIRFKTHPGYLFFVRAQSGSEPFVVSECRSASKISVSDSRENAVAQAEILLKSKSIAETEFQIEKAIKLHGNPPYGWKR